jgi:hypothetical protein
LKPQKPNASTSSLVAQMQKLAPIPPQARLQNHGIDAELASNQFVTAQTIPKASHFFSRHQSTAIQYF